MHPIKLQTLEAVDFAWLWALVEASVVRLLVELREELKVEVLIGAGRNPSDELQALLTSTNMLAKDFTIFSLLRAVCRLALLGLLNKFMFVCFGWCLGSRIFVFLLLVAGVVLLDFGCWFGLGGSEHLARQIRRYF